MRRLCPFPVACVKPGHHLKPNSKPRDFISSAALSTCSAVCSLRFFFENVIIHTLGSELDGANAAALPKASRISSSTGVGAGGHPYPHPSAFTKGKAASSSSVMYPVYGGEAPKKTISVDFGSLYLSPFSTVAVTSAAEADCAFPLWRFDAKAAFVGTAEWGMKIGCLRSFYNAHEL